MKLTENHISELYLFTRQHYVEHYDVQSELVDHLANDIEAIWKENPKLTFEQARDLSFKKFGVFGFMNVVEEKQKQLSKKYFKITLGFVKEWFKLPKLILTSFLVWLFYQIQVIANAYYIYLALYFLIIIFDFIKIVQSKKRIKRKEISTGKKWMLEDIFLAQNTGSLVLIFFYVVDFAMPNSENLMDLSQAGRVFCAFVMVLTIIIAYITIYLIPKNSQDLLKNHYPEYKLV